MKNERNETNSERTHCVRFMIGGGGSSLILKKPLWTLLFFKIQMIDALAEAAKNLGIVLRAP